MLKRFTRSVTPFIRFNSGKIDKNCLYSKDHEWVRVAGKIGTIGISDHAQDQLGDITHVGFERKVGDIVKAHDQIGNVESVKTVSVIYSPVSGKVVEINGELDENGALVNEDPYGKGWMIKIEIEGKAENLLSPSDYEKHVKDSAH